ncbi:MAG: small subunit ribosomal protein [Halanaerobiales bacterium]|nr:small subunit ribosomal protein [Halanaerobiales bacterium]
MVRDYETTFILRPDLEEETREALIERIKNIVTDNNGEIVEVDIWGDRKLAYEINDFRSGYYIVMNFKGEADLVNELERNFKIIDNVLRYLIVRKED